MRRSRIISIIVVLVLANYLVFSNLLMLLLTASNEAITRASATPMPTPTATFAPLAPPVRTDTPTPIPTLTSAPQNTPTAVATTPPAATPTPARALTLIPTYAPVASGTPLKYPFSYTVKAGDTLSGLADRFLVPRAKIMAANGLTDPNLIRIGQVLIIPDPNQ